MVQGPHEYKHYLRKHGDYLKAIHFDSLLIFKLETDKKYRKQNRRPRDGSYGKKEFYIQDEWRGTL